MNPALRAILLTQPSRPPAEMLDLFRNGEKGGIWLPHFTKSMFQDAAMTIPAVVGMPVVKMLDLSGNGNTITFTNVTLQQNSAGKKYLAANGSTSSGVTAAIDLSGTDKVSLWAGVRKASDAAAGCVMEFSTSWALANPGVFMLFAPDANGANTYISGSRGAAAVNANQASTASGYAAPHTAVIATTHDIAADSTTLQVNGVAATAASGDKGSGNFGNYALYFFRRGGTTLPFSGDFYGSILRGAASSAGQVSGVATQLNRYAGATF